MLNVRLKMNIWRIAGTVAAFCSLSVIAFYISAGKFNDLEFHVLHKMVANALFCALFVFTIILFPYYWLKMMKMFISSHFNKKQPLVSDENSAELKGIGISFILILVTLWLGKTFFSGGILA